MDEIFYAFKMTPLSQIKVVIVGQDCYINPNQAMGLCFSVPELTKAPPSLVNIHKELDNENVLREEWSNDLTRWAMQGVFLLNRTMTVRAGESLSHFGHGWERFTTNTIYKIEEQMQPIVYMLWGKNAQQLRDTVHNPNHIVLQSAHPSPLSATRGFFGNNHFAIANNYLIKNGVGPIRW